MFKTIMRSALFVAALVLAVNLSNAADQMTADAGAATGTNKTTPKITRVATKNEKVVAKVKLVDINNASAVVLQTLPGIEKADADKIIAGRPYGSKAHLTTREIVTREVYEGLKKLVIAGQDQWPAKAPSQKLLRSSE